MDGEGQGGDGDGGAGGDPTGAPEEIFKYSRYGSSSNQLRTIKSIKTSRRTHPLEVGHDLGHQGVPGNDSIRFINSLQTLG